jgi:hypothetical protein
VKAATIGIVSVGLALAVVLGIGQGFDATSVTILVATALVGALAIAAADRSKRGVTGPASCEECGGVISPNAPFCKHCGARRAS